MHSHKNKYFELPDFRNISIIMALMTTVLLLVCILAGVFYFKFSGNYLEHFTEVVIWFIPATLTNIIFLMIFNNQLKKIKFNILVVFVSTNIIYYGYYLLLGRPNTIIAVYFTIMNVVYLILFRFYTMRKQNLMPALAESKLIALTSTIRPHFLFNSINTAISLIKPRPDDAEEVLQNMADLFRALLKNNSHNTLQEELELLQVYIEIESIRLGQERLKIIWDINAPDDTITPYLFLQPLLENAIYHGIDNLINPTPIEIKIHKKGTWVYFEIKNPINPNKNELNSTTRGSGHKMTLQNLRERLSLMFSKDAILHHNSQNNYFIVTIRIPYYTQFSLH